MENAQSGQLYHTSKSWKRLFASVGSTAHSRSFLTGASFSAYLLAARTAIGRNLTWTDARISRSAAS